jgi:hypothetical protein
MTATQTTAKCLGCGRVLRAANSVALGRGRRCLAKVREAVKVAASAFKPAQVAKAEELIADGGIIAIRGRRAFHTVSTDGARTYLTAPQTCTCAAGLKSERADQRVCFHRVAASILAAA